MIKGKNLDWYFISRLSTNIEFSDKIVGDRALMVLQGKGVY